MNGEYTICKDKSNLDIIYKGEFVEYEIPDEKDFI